MASFAAVSACSGAGATPARLSN